MQTRQMRRFVFLLFLIQEVSIFLRATAEERKQAPIPPYPGLFGLSMLGPFFLKFSPPPWVERIALGFQLLGNALELTALFQLSRQRSFGIHPTAATQPLQQGLYRLEHPIYLGLLLNVLGWTLRTPPAMLAVLLMYMGLRRAVRRERAHLASLKHHHRGLDSFLWPNL